MSVRAQVSKSTTFPRFYKPPSTVHYPPRMMMLLALFFLFDHIETSLLFPPLNLFFPAPRVSCSQSDIYTNSLVLSLSLFLLYWAYL